MIERNENIIKFEKALSVDENLRNKYEAALKKIADEKLAESDGEAMVKAAKELGYEISIDEMERSFAAIQELDDEELSDAAGGEVSKISKTKSKSKKPCGTAIMKAQKAEDENGHGGFCLGVWHCFTAFLHTDSDSDGVACLADYRCIAVNK